MAIVTGMTANKIEEIDDTSLVGGSISPDGHIVMETRAGGLIDIGSAQATVLNTVYPVGSIYMSTSSANPSTIFGLGVWESWGSGRVPIGVDPSDSSMSSPNQVGGAKDKSLDMDSLPAHSHSSAAHSHTINHGHAASATSDAHFHQVKVKYISNTASGGTGGRITDVGDVAGNGGTAANANTTSDSHTHGVTVVNFSGSSGSTTPPNTGISGNGQPFSILQPYVTCYMWRRTA